MIQVHTYILDKYAEEMDFDIVGEQTVVHMLFGGSKSKPQAHKGYQVSIKSLDDSYFCNFVALDQNVICENIPSIRGGPWLQELRRTGIQLTDADTKEEPIVLLIGADIAGKLMMEDASNLNAERSHLRHYLVGH